MKDKITASDLGKQAQELVESGKMPQLEDLLEAISGTREKYSEMIKDAQRDTKS